MIRATHLLTSVSLVTLLASSAAAQTASPTPAAASNAPAPTPVLAMNPVPPRENSINGSPIGIVAGNYSLNYERLFNGTHGLMVEGTLGISNGSNAKSSLYGGAVGYRWHWSGRQNSGFLGLMAGYSAGSGTGTITSGNMTESFDLNIKAPWVVGNIGKRWAWDNGFNITFRIGGGWAGYTVTTDSTDPDAKEAAQLVQDLLKFLPIAFDGELSIGYAF